MCISKYKQRLFLVTHINWKWTFGILGQWCCRNVSYKIDHLMICISIKTFSNTNLVVSRYTKTEKASLSVDMYHQKKSWLKLPTIQRIMWQWWGWGSWYLFLKYQFFRSIWLLYVDIGAHHDALLNFQVTDMSCTVWQRHIKLLIAL